MRVEVLRCFKTDLGIHGEYYVYDSQDRKTLVLQNENDIKGFIHLRGKKVEDCILSVMQAVKDAVIMASVEYLKNK